MLKYLKDPDAGVPVNRKPRGAGPGRKCKLNTEHTAYIKQFFRGQSDAYVQDLVKAIKKDFGIEVAESTLRRHIKKHCHLSLKRLRPQPEARFTPELLEQRKTWVENWQSEEDFTKRAVFIDEAGFNLHMR
ncbi:hypothetical protein BG003_003087, partial [Podila horticola]